MDKNQTCLKRFARIMLSHIGLLVIVVIYAVAGAYWFIKLESSYEALQNRIKNLKYLDVQDAKKYIVYDMWLQNSQNHTGTEFILLAGNNLKMFHDFVVDAVQNSYYDGRNDTDIYNWSFSKSLLFTVTTMAAIGYGHIAPKTFNGQLFCIIYAVVGVPLLLLFLANIGEVLADTFRYIYSRGCCVTCRFSRRKNEASKDVKPKSVFKDMVGNEVYMPTSEVQVPITVNVCVVAFYLMAGGLLFKLWEGWQFHSAAYFSFITLSTIGFGDYVPGNSFNMGKDSAVVAGLKMLATIVFSLFGMALLSMCINLIQEQIMSKFKWMAKELGMNDEEEDQQAKHKYRKTEYEVTTTPPGKDGNNYLQNLEEKPRHKFRRRPLSTDSRGYVKLSEMN
uniref:Potassium channel subfamily K member 18-like n=1 Tax=Hirondellea gigas TaxID=1518452 RepID=A0A2P2I3U1_9CRUS